MDPAAIRRAALEEAARVCDDIAIVHEVCRKQGRGGTQPWPILVRKVSIESERTAKKCAKAIRALLASPAPAYLDSTPARVPAPLGASLTPEEEKRAVETARSVSFDSAPATMAPEPPCHKIPGSACVDQYPPTPGENAKRSLHGGSSPAPASMGATEPCAVCVAQGREPKDYCREPRVAPTPAAPDAERCGKCESIDPRVRNCVRWEKEEPRDVPNHEAHAEPSWGCVPCDNDEFHNTPRGKEEA